MTQHAPLAPSAAARWISCPGSIAATRTALPERPSLFAEEGTQAHALFAQCLLTGASVGDLVGDSPMLVPLHNAVTWARELIGRCPVLIEQILPPLPGVPDIWGTADVCIFDLTHRIESVIDLKYGVALPVEAHTIQLAIYATLAGHQFGVSPRGVTVSVIQPRCPHPDGPVRSYTYSPDDLARMAEQLGFAAAATMQPDAPRRAGYWCRFCPARPGCEELRRTPGAIAPISGNTPQLFGDAPW